MGRRGKIEANDVGGFRFKIWILASHVMTQSMGLKPVATPDARDAHVIDAELAARRRLLQ